MDLSNNRTVLSQLLVKEELICTQRLVGLRDGERLLNPGEKGYEE